MRQLVSRLLQIGMGVLFWVGISVSPVIAQESGSASSSSASAPSAFTHELTLSGGYLGISPESGGYNIAPAYYFKPLKLDLIQVGGEFGYHLANHRGASVTNVTLLAGVTLNFGSLSNAYYCMLGMALKSGSGGSAEDSTLKDPDGFGYHFLIGKRFSIGNSQRWLIKPSVGVIYGGTGGFVFRPLAVSYLF